MILQPLFGVPRDRRYAEQGFFHARILPRSPGPRGFPRFFMHTRHSGDYEKILFPEAFISNARRR
jgi:hypothetical protein